MMTNEQNKAVVRRFWKAFEANDSVTLNELWSSDFTAQNPSSPDPLNRQMFLQTVNMFNAAFSDRQFTVEELIAEGEKVATRVTMRAVHTGNWQGFPATGKPFAATVLTIEHVKNEQIADRWFSFDGARVLRELGLTAPLQAHP